MKTADRHTTTTWLAGISFLILAQLSFPLKQFHVVDWKIRNRLSEPVTAQLKRKLSWPLSLNFTEALSIESKMLISFYRKVNVVHLTRYSFSVLAYSCVEISESMFKKYCCLQRNHLSTAYLVKLRLFTPTIP